MWNNSDRVSRRRSLMVAGLGMLLFLSPARAVHAFKIGTHLWIGARVLLELEENDGFTLPGFGGVVPVHPRIRNALLAHKEAYLMGCLGPDSYPDMVVGQITTHPGGDREQHHEACEFPPNIWETDPSTSLARGNASPPSPPRSLGSVSQR